MRCHDDIGWAIDDARRRARRASTGAGAPALPLRLVRRRVPRLVGRGPGLPGTTRDRRPADQRDRGVLAGLHRGQPAPTRTAALARLFLAHAIVAGWGGVPGDLERRRAGPAQRPRLGRRAGPRGRQPLGAPARGSTGRARPPAPRPAHRPGPGLRRARAPGPGPRLAAAAARLGADRGAPGHRRRGARRGPPPRQRALRRPLQRHRPARARSRCTGCTRPALTTPYDALGGHLLEVGGDGVLWLPPYAAWWVVDAPAPDAGHALTGVRADARSPSRTLGPRDSLREGHQDLPRHGRPRPRPGDASTSRRASSSSSSGQSGSGKSTALRLVLRETRATVRPRLRRRQGDQPARRLEGAAAAPPDRHRVPGLPAAAEQDRLARTSPSRCR